MQRGGRRGLGIEPLHLHIRLWQSNARHTRGSLALVFIDLKTAFYSVVKPMLAGFDGSMEAVATIFQTLKLPSSAYNGFLANVMEGDLVKRATQAEIVADNVGASLANTWFAIPNGKEVCAPQTGSRPGDPCADVLFGYIMAQMLAQIQGRAEEAQIPLHVQCGDGELTHCVTRVDDIAFAIFAAADSLVQNTQVLLPFAVYHHGCHNWTWHAHVIWTIKDSSNSWVQGCQFHYSTKGLWEIAQWKAAGVFRAWWSGCSPAGGSLQAFGWTCSEGRNEAPWDPDTSGCSTTEHCSSRTSSFAWHGLRRAETCFGAKFGFFCAASSFKYLVCYEPRGGRCMGSGLVSHISDAREQNRQGRCQTQGALSAGSEN